MLRAARDAGRSASARTGPLPVTEVTAALYYLLIAIRSPVSAGIEVKGWLSAGRETVYLKAGEELHTREQLPVVVDHLRRLAEAQDAALGNLWVEFLLPRKLIPAAVDQWGA